jgi:hypothetical protein
MKEKFNWHKFEKDETARILSEMETIERNKPQSTATCINHSDESTLKSFKRAVEVSIDLFAEKTKNLR